MFVPGDAPLAQSNTPAMRALPLTFGVVYHHPVRRAAGATELVGLVGKICGRLRVAVVVEWSFLGKPRQARCQVASICRSDEKRRSNRTTQQQTADEPLSSVPEDA